MFKEKDKMRQGPTPERVLAVCRVLDGEKCTKQQLFQKLQLDPSSSLSTDESFNRSLETAMELELIKQSGTVYLLNVPSELLYEYKAYRKETAKRAFSNHESTFFKMTEWYINNPEILAGLSSYDNIAIEAAKGGVPNIDGNAIHGWRFWIYFLGLGYQFKKTIIPNMKIRLEDALSDIEPGTEYAGGKFVQWIKSNIPEAASGINNQKLPLALSNGIRTLAEEHKVELINTRDAAAIGLYKFEGATQNSFSSIVIKEEMK